MARRLALPGNKGVSLIEVLIALVILAIVSLAMMRIALLAISTNLQNALRDEAVSVADMQINQMRAVPWSKTDVTVPTLLSAGTVTTTVTRHLRSFTENYTVTTSVTDIPPDTKQILVTVKWYYRNQQYSHGASTIKRRE